MNFKKLLSAAVAAITSISMLTACGTTNTATTEAAIVMRDMTTAEIVADMGVGINLGNTLECSGGSFGNTVTAYETAWGSPVITEDMIKGYAECGFGVLRVPVAWSNMMGENYTISEEYITRVKEIVTWATDSGMYVIMNIHWDGGWWEKFPEDKENCMTKYTSIWEQLCDAFGDFDDHLMFESLNEEGGWDSLWNRYSNQGDKEASYGLLNEINQKFVDIVRASGKNNGERHLLIAGYGTDIDLTCDELYVMPTDPQNRCAVSVHYYTPSTFTIIDKDESWGKMQTEWGSDSDRAELDKYMTKVKERFIDNGVPVILGEYGAVSRKNRTEDMLREYTASVCKVAYEKGICPVLWDTPNNFYNRLTAEFVDQELLTEIMSVKSSEQ